MFLIGYEVIFRDLENFHMAEVDLGKEDSHDKGDDEGAREERKFG